MCSVAVIVLLAFIAQAHRQDSSDSVNNLRDKLVDRSLIAWLPHDVIMDSTTLAKPQSVPAHVTASLPGLHLFPSSRLLFSSSVPPQACAIHFFPTIRKSLPVRATPLYEPGSGAEVEAKRKGSNENKDKVRTSRIISQRPSKIAKREDFERRCQAGPTVVVDCSFEHKMSDMERRSLAQQIRRAYAAIKKAELPCNLVLAGLMEGGSESVHETLQKNGLWNWAVSVSDQPVQELFDLAHCVYMSPDGEEVVQRFDSNQVYIIGGLVDRGYVLKGTTLARANQMGVPTARLPLSYKEKSDNVLNVNHVITIIMEHMRTEDWVETIQTCTPKRKGISYSHPDRA